MTIFSYRQKFHPMNALQQLQTELERVFENPTGVDLGSTGRGVFPPANVFSDGDDVVVRLEIPGVEPHALSVDAKGQRLVISGKRDEVSLAEGSFHRRERWSGEFSRSLALPREVDPSKAKAQYKNGILTIRVPGREEAKPRQIEVKIG